MPDENVVLMLLELVITSATWNYFRTDKETKLAASVCTQVALDWQAEITCRRMLLMAAVTRAPVHMLSCA